MFCVQKSKEEKCLFSLCKRVYLVAVLFMQCIMYALCVQRTTNQNYHTNGGELVCILYIQVIALCDAELHFKCIYSNYSFINRFESNSFLKARELCN